MPNTRTLRAKSPSDLLAMVPYLMGFHPEDSVVLVSLGGVGNPFHARADLPVDPLEVDELARHLAGATRRNHVAKVALVLYTDDEHRAEDVAAALTRVLADAGTTTAEAIRADGTRWYSLSGCTGPCCPAGGTPYDVASHPLTAQSVLDGQVTLASRRELQDSLAGTDLAEIEAVGRAADHAMTRLTAAARHPVGPPVLAAGRAHLVREGRWLAETVRGFLADRRRLSPEQVGRLLVGMVAIEVRDVAWAEMTHDNAEGHVDLWRDVVRRAPSDLIAAPAALLGFAAWLSGDGALAWCAVDRCQEAEPDYSLAALLSQALAGAVPPSSWQPFDRSMLTLFAG